MLKRVFHVQRRLLIERRSSVAGWDGRDLVRRAAGVLDTEADLSGADLSQAFLGQTTFANVDLSEVMGLDSAWHTGPSTVGVDTLMKSRGNIADVFLRGCGVPDSVITSLPSLIGVQHAIQFHSCFISYSSQGEEFCRRLYSRMRDEHLRVWFAPKDIQGGKKVLEQIDEAIRLHDKLLLVVSDHSMVSKWVRVEMKKALLREKREGKCVLFPIRLVPFERLDKWEAFYADIVKDNPDVKRRFPSRQSVASPGPTVCGYAVRIMPQGRAGRTASND